MRTRRAAAASSQLIPPAEFAAMEATVAHGTSAGLADKAPPARSVICILFIKTLTQTQPSRHPSQAPPTQTRPSGPTAHMASAVPSGQGIQSRPFPQPPPAQTRPSGPAAHMASAVPSGQGIQPRPFPQAPPAQTRPSGPAAHMASAVPPGQGIQPRPFPQAPPAQTRPSGPAHMASAVPSGQGLQVQSSTQYPPTNPFTQTHPTTQHQRSLASGHSNVPPPASSTIHRPSMAHNQPIHPPPAPLQYTFQVETPAAVRERLNMSPSRNARRNHVRANAIIFTPNRQSGHRAPVAQYSIPNSPTPAGRQRFATPSELDEPIRGLNLGGPAHSRSSDSVRQPHSVLHPTAGPLHARPGRKAPPRKAKSKKASDAWSFVEAQPDGRKCCLFCKYVKF